MSNSLKIPKIIGHRGAAAYAPENTLEGIHTAADMGVEWVELDVKLTRDQVPIMFHDDALDRTTNGAGNVAETDYTDLKQLEAGSWFAESFAGIKIPTLEEALEVIIDRGLGLNLEIKPCPGREIETAEVALDLLTSIWDTPNNILISSFQHPSLETALEMAPDWPRGFLMAADWPENWQDLVKHLECTSLNMNQKSCTREKIEDVIEFDPELIRYVYTVNDPMRANELISWGIQSMTSDEPDIVKDGLFSVH